MSLKINIINPHGFCFGVNRAVVLARETAQKYPKNTYLLGEIVHNPFVNEDLKNNYHIQTVSSIADIPTGSTVIFCAHGSPPSLFKQSKIRELIVVDAVCPIVVQVHQLVKKLVSENKKIIYLASDYNHDEAKGVLSQAPESITLTTLKDIYSLVISSPEICHVITQTTLSVIETQKTLDYLTKTYPTISIHPHICLATSDRQKTIIESAKDSDLIIINGSKNSSNSLRLLETAKSQNPNSFIVESADDLDPLWFKNISSVAISSGASTPENIFNLVVEKIKTMTQN